MLYKGHYRKILITKESKLNGSHVLLVLIVKTNTVSLTRFKKLCLTTLYAHKRHHLPLQGPQYPSQSSTSGLKVGGPPTIPPYIHMLPDIPGVVNILGL